MSDSITQYFSKMQLLPEADLQLFTRHFEPQIFSKGEIIISPGSTQKRLYFIERGVQMSYHETESKLHVIAFTHAPGLCAIPESFCFQKPSAYYLKAITESHVLGISYTDLENTLAKSHPLERLFRKMTEGVLAGMITRHIELHTLTIEQRFLSFSQRSGHLLNIIPHKYIASYLGIDSTNFSKLYNSIRI